VCNEAATLVYLANQACITPHSWLSRRDKLNQPDLMVFDIDTPTNDFEPVRDATRTLCELLDDLELPCFLQTTGSKGIHIAVPLKRHQDFDEVRAFARDIADLLAKRHPKQLTVEQRKDKRGARVFLDTNRNAYGQTMVTPYSVRPRPGAPVATPIERDELDDGALRSDRYTISSIFRRLGQRMDPWGGLRKHAVTLSSSRDRLADIKKADSK
jgi:bifunctional non-homologous end joining protein LigD